METVLLTDVKADDSKIQRSVHYFSTLFIKQTKQTKKRFAGYRCKHHFPVVKPAMVKLKHRHPDSFFFFF